MRNTILNSNFRWPSQYRLSTPAQIVALFANLGLGIFPGMVLFYTWVERSCSYTWMSERISWPVIFLQPLSLVSKGFWNISLVLLFGFVHSLFAQHTIQRRIEKFIPPQLIRTLFICVTGTTLLGIMAFWQPTGINVWVFPLPSMVSLGLSLFTFWMLILCAGLFLTRFGILKFMGLQQLRMSVQEIQRAEGTPQLIITGIYRWIRHPIYTFTLLAFILTPEMSLDRLLLVGAMALYLLVGIPVEERKLIKLFGQEYLAYRRRTPALIPSPFRILSGCPEKPGLNAGP